MEVLDESAADPERAAWKVRTRKRYDDDATRAEIDRDRACGQPVPAEAPDAVKTSAPATDGDALLVLAQDALADEKPAHPDIDRRRRPQLSPQVDPLSGWARQRDGELLPPSRLGAVLKTLPGRGGPGRLRPLTPADLRPHDLGRSQRVVSGPLRDLLGTIDGECCRFPGCTRHNKLHAHHVVYWQDGGATDLENLVRVCSRHHTLIHSTGFRLVLHPDRRLDVRTADGVPVLHHPAQPWRDPPELDPTGRVSAGTLPPDWDLVELFGYRGAVRLMVSDLGRRGRRGGSFGWSARCCRVALLAGSRRCGELRAWHQRRRRLAQPPRQFTAYGAGCIHVHEPLACGAGPRAVAAPDLRQRP